MVGDMFKSLLIIIMETQIKVVGELDKLLKESTSNTMLKPDLARFQRMAELINSKPTIPKEFAKLLKSRLAAAKHPKSQFLLLDLIEYTTCKCGIHLHNEYNSKVFLQQINAIFNQKMLTDEVRDKGLFLVQFWNNFFSNRADVLSSFSEYYNNIKKRGVQFPAKTQSDYFVANETPVRGVSTEERTPVYSVDAIIRGQDANTIDTSTLTDKQRKLWTDLNVVVDNVELANNMIDAKEWDSLEEVMSNLEAMERKLQMLPDKLQKADEEFLCNFTRALLADIITSRNRYLALGQGVRPEPFDSKTNAAIRKFNAGNKTASIDRDDDFGIIAKAPAPKVAKNTGGFDGFGDDGFGMPTKNPVANNMAQGFDDISNDFGPDVRAPSAKSDPFGNTNDFDFGGPAKSKPQTSLKDEFNLLDFDAKAEQQPEKMTFGSSPINKTPFDMDFTYEAQKQPVNVETAFGMQAPKTKFVPVGDVKFENENTFFGSDAAEVDPFSNITDFSDFGMAKRDNKAKPAHKDDEFLF